MKLTAHRLENSRWQPLVGGAIADQASQAIAQIAIALAQEPAVTPDPGLMLGRWTARPRTAPRKSATAQPHNYIPCQPG